jgi:arylsulfatase A
VFTVVLKKFNNPKGKKMGRNNYTRRKFVYTTGMGTLALSSLGISESLAQGSKSPNIIFIMTDDLGFGDVSCYNPESKIQTPNLDRLAEEGIRFTDAHSPAAVCTPTRYSVMTGRYCWRSRLKRGVFGGYNRPLIEPNRETVASLLKKSGYATACIGKWHLGLNWQTKDGTQPDIDGGYEQMNIDFSKPISGGPTDLGFDYFFGTSGCTTDDPPICFIENNRTVGIPDFITPADTANERREMLMVKGWKHEDADVAFTKKTIEFIEKHLKNRPRDPFFVYLPLSIPHIPWIPPDFVKGKSQAGPRGDQVVLADWCTAEIVAALDRLKISDNTLLIFTSDNGPRKGVFGHKSAGDWRGYKGSIFEGGHRVPFIARWPAKIKAGSISNEVTTFTDLMATCAALAGTSVPNNAGEDSYNILPAFFGEITDKPIREATIHHSGGGEFALRQGPWKLIERLPRSRRNQQTSEETTYQLYNLKNDPAEENDLVEQHPEIVQRLTQLLNTYRDQGYSRPLTG